ncbi:MAG: transcription repressor NadR [Anaerolineae bacterium]|nr:transcription repressor NadR [Anaerolineae bacterium]MDW8098077.1 transcription repressor NadR [Anaerolineae bacterium]
METHERRQAILAYLQATREPVPGSALAKQFGVSRQVIVQDMSVLRAAGHPILPTTRGYIWLSAAGAPRPRIVVAVRHTPEQTQDELERLVDLGVTVVDVIVEHPIYGEVKGQLMHSTRAHVRAFMEKLRETQARLLSELTDGVHLHTLEADDPARLDMAIAVLRQAGYLIE